MFHHILSTISCVSSTSKSLSSSKQIQDPSTCTPPPKFFVGIVFVNFDCTTHILFDCSHHCYVYNMYSIHYSYYEISGICDEASKQSQEFPDYPSPFLKFLDPSQIFVLKKHHKQTKLQTLEHALDFSYVDHLCWPQVDTYHLWSCLGLSAGIYLDPPAKHWKFT